MKNHLPSGLDENQWNTLLADMKKRPSTVNDYRKVLNLLHAYEDGKFHIATMTPADAKEYFDYLDQRVSDGSMSVRTSHRYKATLRSIAARMEGHPELFPDYVNPFRRLIKGELRSRTQYTEEMFADPAIIERLQAILPELPANDAMILDMMIHVGFSPIQIQNLQVNHFQTLPDGRLCLQGKEADGTPTVFEFTEEFSRRLRKKVPTLGRNRDRRSFFMTARHLEYSHRALYHMFREACKTAGIDTKTLTPRQVSLYGRVHSWLLLETAGRLQNDDLSTAERQDLEDKMARLMPEQVGRWSVPCPRELTEQIEAIKTQMGDDYLWKMIG
ncbi:MAG: hypothetical protein IKF35_11000 [Solobacterium sp.]|nr:hypothetical protein [Solobacterium sp.]